MKSSSLMVIVLIFVGLLIGSYALWDEMSSTVHTSDVVEITKEASVVVYAPEAQSTIASPLTISGKARGYWYFEASFPIEIIDANGKRLGSGIAQAQGDWMTEEYVPFSTTVSFEGATTSTGFILFMKDNPSGLPENDATIAVPVTFSK